MEQFENFAKNTQSLGFYFWLLLLLYQHLCYDIIRVATPIVQENTVDASCALLAGINTSDCEKRLGGGERSNHYSRYTGTLLLLLALLVLLLLAPCGNWFTLWIRSAWMTGALWKWRTDNGFYIVRTTKCCWPPAALTDKKITLFSIFFLYHQKYHCCKFPSNIFCHFEAIASTHKGLNKTVQLRIIGWMLFQLNFYNLHQYRLNLLPTHEKLNAAACILHLKACGPCVDVFSSVPYTDADFNDSNCGWWREPFSLVPNWINLYKSHTLTTEQ